MISNGENLAQLRLWRAVHCATLVDAARAVIKKQQPTHFPAPMSKEQAVREEMRYFTSRSYRTVCEYAENSCDPIAIEAWLSRDDLATKVTEIRRNGEQ